MDRWVTHVVATTVVVLIVVAIVLPRLRRRKATARRAQDMEKLAADAGWTYVSTSESALPLVRKLPRSYGRGSRANQQQDLPHRGTDTSARRIGCVQCGRWTHSCSCNLHGDWTASLTFVYRQASNPKARPAGLLPGRRHTRVVAGQGTRYRNGDLWLAEVAGGHHADHHHNHINLLFA
jgi:hypothetical protein